jgi:hypothetical protein
MKKLLRGLGLILLLAACQNTENKVVENTGSTVDDSTQEKTLELPYNAEYNENTQKLELKHNTADVSKLTLADMVEAINLKYPEIKLQLVGAKDHTAHVKIDDASYLSEDLGSTGSNTYMAEATYALTEIAGITAVNFAFKEGDHAAPGVYTRADFKGFN